MKEQTAQRTCVEELRDPRSSMGTVKPINDLFLHLLQHPGPSQDRAGSQHRHWKCKFGRLGEPMAAAGQVPRKQIQVEFGASPQAWTRSMGRMWDWPGGCHDLRTPPLGWSPRGALS